MEDDFFEDMINSVTWHKPSNEPSQDNEIEDWLNN